MKLEYKGVIWVSGPAITNALRKGEDELRALIGAEADELISNRLRRDGQLPHITLLNPTAVKEAIEVIRSGNPGISKSEGEKRLKNLVESGPLGNELNSPFTVKGIGHAKAGGKEAYYLVLHWPAAEAIRDILRVDPKGHDFHITIGFGANGDVHGVPKRQVMASTLRAEVVKLAKTNPELRKALVPLLKEAADTFKLKYSPKVEEVMRKHKLTDKAFAEINEFGGVVEQLDKGMSEAALLKHYLAETTSSGAALVKGMSPKEFMVLVKAPAGKKAASEFRQANLNNAVLARMKGWSDGPVTTWAPHIEDEVFADLWDYTYTEAKGKGQAYSDTLWKQVVGVVKREVQNVFAEATEKAQYQEDNYGEEALIREWLRAKKLLQAKVAEAGREGGPDVEPEGKTASSTNVKLPTSLQLYSTVPGSKAAEKEILAAMARIGKKLVNSTDPSSVLTDGYRVLTTLFQKHRAYGAYDTEPQFEVANYFFKILRELDIDYNAAERLIDSVR